MNRLDHLREAVTHVFRSLSVRNYRLFFWGQMVSISGTWMQTVAQDWLVLRLTNQPLPVGITTALQFLPVTLVGLWSGTIADRFDKRKILIATQSTMGVLALVLGLLTLTGSVQLWMIYTLAFLLGCATAVDNPARQAFVSEMVGPEYTSNAISLNSAVFNSARIIGPALAGVVITTLGLAPAFLCNAASFGAVLGALAAMNPAELQREVPVGRSGKHIRDGLRYVWGTPELRSTLFLVSVVAVLGMNFRVVLPLLARFTFQGNAGSYAILASLFAVGSVFGALFTASRPRPTRRLLVGAASLFGLFSLMAAAAPSLAWEGACLIPLGAASITFLATANATLQLSSVPAMRGRVMSLYAVVFLGSTPLGGVLVGWLSEHLGARSGLLLAAMSGLIATAGALAASVRRRRMAAVSSAQTPKTGGRGAES